MKTLLNITAVTALITALSAAALVGCNSTAPNNAKTTTAVQTTTTTQNTTHIAAQPVVVQTTTQAATRTFRCQNGFMPKITYLNTNQAQISVQGKTQVLNIATSGSGARYVATTGMWGTGAEWHEKGNEAIFIFKGTDGSTVETACQAM